MAPSSPPDASSLIESFDIKLIKLAFGLAVAVATIAAPFLIFAQFVLAPEAVRRSTPLWQQALNVTGVIGFAVFTVFSSLMFFRSFIPILRLTAWWKRFPVLALLWTLWGVYGKDIALAFWKPIYSYYGIKVTPEMEEMARQGIRPATHQPPRRRAAPPAPKRTPKASAAQQQPAAVTPSSPDTAR